LDLIFNTALGSIAKHELASRRQKIYTPRYQWPLAASLATLLASLLIGTRRRRTARRSVSAAAISGLAVFLVLPVHATRAEGGETQGASLQTSRESKKPLLEYNAGTAAYRAGEFPQAAQAFQQSISHLPSGDAARLSDQQDAYYNLGNSLYRAGQRTEKASAQETLQKWNDAVKAYETALQLRANDADAKFNRDFVKRKIDELNQQQKNNQDQPQNKDQQQNPNQQPDKSAKNNDPKQGQGQPPPQGQGQPPPGQGQGQPPPQGQGQPPPQGQGQPPPQGQGQQPQSGAGEPQNSGDDTRAADNQRSPGQMSREEARELLDSVKGDERRPPGAPLAQHNAVDPPEKPYKNW
jgi:tetratricopeptide (TPR) repeat protein